MSLFILLIRVSPQSIRSPKSLEALEKEVMTRIRKECPENGTNHLRQKKGRRKTYEG